MPINLDAVVIQLVAGIIIISPVLWLSGRAIVGKEKAKFVDAIWIVVLGTLIGGIFGFFFTGIIAAIIQLLIWIALVKHFFDTGWLTALGISILAVIIFVVIAVVLGVVGFAIWALI